MSRTNSIHGLAVLVLHALVGCGGSEMRAKPAVHPVEGRLIVGGQPAGNAQIAFHHRGDPAPPAVGVTAADGTFRLTTYAPGDGATAGEHVVTVVWPNSDKPIDECADPVSHDRLNGRYADPAAGRLVVVVRPEANTITLEVQVASSGWALPRHASGK